MHTIILGNGIIALTIAFRLARRSTQNDRISIIGKKSRDGSATLAAGAMLNSFAEIEVGSLEADIDLYRFELSHLATQMWAKFERDLIDVAGSCLPYGCSKCQGISGGGCLEMGTYVINNSAADDLDDENYDAILQALENFNEPFQHISPKDIPNYMPEQRNRATRALYLPNEGWFNPRLMIEKLDAILGKFPQVEFINSNVDKLIMTGDVIDRVSLEGGIVLSGDKFVLSTGATISTILDRSNLGIEVQPVFYGVGVSLEIRSPEFPHVKCIRTPNRGLACGIYSVPYFTGPDVPMDHILLGATNFVSPVPRYEGRISSVESIIKASTEQINFNFFRADLLRVNVGLRPSSQDTYPLLGRSSIDNLFIASGTKRDGFHMSPVISEKIVAMLYDEPVDERFAVFAPERKLIHSLTRVGAIEKGVRHQISAAYQHGFTAPQGRMLEQIKKMYREDLERLHDQVGAYDWGIPPDMIEMYRYGHAKF